MTTLRLQQGRFIGRHAELAQLDRCLAQHAGAWLVGAAGVGRTRLATEWAQRQQRPAYIARAAGAEPPEEVLAIIARVAGVPLATWSQIDELNAVVVLQLTAPDAAIPVTLPWMSEPQSTQTRVILVADHRPANIHMSAHAEAWPVLPLSGLPFDGASHADLEAVQLYVARVAERVAPSVVPARLDDVARLASLLQGVPLWMELAASAAGLLSAPRRVLLVSVK
jgi:hypothetical protein